MNAAITLIINTLEGALQFGTEQEKIDALLDAKRHIDETLNRAPFTKTPCPRCGEPVNTRCPTCFSEDVNANEVFTDLF